MHSQSVSKVSWKAAGHFNVFDSKVKLEFFFERVCDSSQFECLLD